MANWFVLASILVCFSLDSSKCNKFNFDSADLIVDQLEAFQSVNSANLIWVSLGQIKLSSAKQGGPLFDPLIGGFATHLEFSLSDVSKKKLATEASKKYSGSIKENQIRKCPVSKVICSIESTISATSLIAKIASPFSADDTHIRLEFKIPNDLERKNLKDKIKIAKLELKFEIELNAEFSTRFTIPLATNKPYISVTDKAFNDNEKLRFQKQSR
jgi:hypothetical protein